MTSPYRELGVFLVLLLVYPGCVSTSEPVKPVPEPKPTATEVADTSARTDLKAVERMVRAGDYSHVLPRLLGIISEHGGTKAAQEAHYWMGVVYHEIGGVRDAVDYLEEYVTNWPEGDHVADARKRLTQLTEGKGEDYVTPPQLDNRIAAVKEKLEENPDTLAYELELADLYWKNGQYQEAGTLYKEALNEQPGLAKDKAIRDRMEKGPAGEWQIVTPAEMVQRQADADPLLIYNTSSFRSGRFHPHRIQLENSIYNVTGYATNRGSAPLKNVELIVTIHAFNSRVLDTRQVRLGTLAPGEHRPFSVQLVNFENIENVYDYEVYGNYDRY